MNCLEWNNLIARHIFNEDSASKNVYLYLSKEDITEIGKSTLLVTNNDAIWKDFICAIKNCLPESKCGSPIIEMAIKVFEDWVNLSNTLYGSNSNFYPPYLIYLILTVLPLTEAHRNFDPRNYYEPFKQFLEKNDLPAEKIDTQNFKKLDVLWDDLLVWANNKKAGSLGVFQLHNFGNPNWIHVGKPLSQCLLSPSNLLKLPDLFNEAKLTPYSNYSSEYFLKIVLFHNDNILKLKDFVYKILKENKDTEIVKAILGIIKKEFQKWNGETERKIVFEHTEKVAKGYTIAKICFQLKINTINEKIEISNRLFSENEYPDNLIFNDIQVNYEINGFSSTVLFNLDYCHEYTDENNKWIARFPNSEIRLFINAGYYQLSNSYFIETNSLSRVNPMYMLCKEEFNSEILTWGENFMSGDFKKIEFEGIPSGFSLFWLRNPQISNPKFETLQILYNKSIETKEGIHLKGKSYHYLYPPYIDIKNADGTENVFIEYTNDGTLIFLEKDKNFKDRFYFPKGIKCNIPFKIKIKDQELASYAYSYELIKTNLEEILKFPYNIPLRNKFGLRTDNLDLSIVKGNDIITKKGFAETQRQYVDLFKRNYVLGITFSSQKNNITYTNYDDPLLSYLSTIKTCTINDFYNNFEFFYNKISSAEKTPENLSRAKKTALYHYSNLGFIECFYESRQIYICPPQLFLIPSQYGRKAIITGARNEELIQKINKYSKKLDIKFNIVNQNDKKNEFLLPNIISLFSFSNDSKRDESKLYDLSKKCDIAFNKDIFNQIGFMIMSSSVNEYRDFMFSNMESPKEDYPWGRYIFNSETFTFDPNYTDNFNKELSLVEYRLDYKLNQKLWMSNKCFNINKTWGRYLVLKRMGKNVILYDKKNEILAIPVLLPLPLLLAKALVMLSGEIPPRQFINYCNKNFLYYLYKNIPESIARHISGIKLGQTLISENINFNI
ncbi:MAG: hypothetical protein PHN88_04660 [Ignavibacteria bacterium]|nr:hypothetical protein [Ignavibacteria bacterium]